MEMNERFDYQQQLAEQERREQEEFEKRWEEYMETNRAFMRAMRVNWSTKTWPSSSRK